MNLIMTKRINREYREPYLGSRDRLFFLPNDLPDEEVLPILSKAIGQEIQDLYTRIYRRVEYRSSQHSVVDEPTREYKATLKFTVREEERYVVYRYTIHELEPGTLVQLES